MSRLEQPADQQAGTNTPARHLILGTAGHIDHGKTSLVKALTGVDADRLPEEQRRGMTIELGFAELDLGDVRLGIVDVPGHERFVRTMVAGATGIDMAMIVVAADDSIMPQTREHVEILRMLGVSRAVVAISKADLVDEEMLELVGAELSELLADTPFSNASMCPVSSTTGAGLDALRAALHDVAAATTPRSADPPFRMAVDRVFTVQGRGTVVTGSAHRGRLSVGDTVEVWPGGGTCRVRDLQSHGRAVREVERGSRTAINVSGIEREALERGVELATPGYLRPSNLVDARIQVLESHDRAMKSARVVRLGIGTVELPVRVVLLGTDSLGPGESGFAQLRSGQPLTCTYGQRFILRDENATRTIGGGTVLRPVARRKRRGAHDDTQALSKLESGSELERLEEVLREAAFAQLSELQLCGRTGIEVDELGTLLGQLAAEGRWSELPGSSTRVTQGAVEDLGARLSAWLERYHRQNPDRPGRHAHSVIGWLERMTSPAIARPLLEELTRRKVVKPFGDFICLPAFAPALSTADERLFDQLVGAFRAAGFSPPSMEKLATELKSDRKRLEKLAILAVASGLLVLVAPGLYLHAEAESELRERVRGLLQEKGRATVSEIREALDSSRKYVVPFVEYLDRIGFTCRKGDERMLAESRE